MADFFQMASDSYFFIEFNFNYSCCQGWAEVASVFNFFSPEWMSLNSFHNDMVVACKKALWIYYSASYLVPSDSRENIAVTVG